jgi:hypothetical protein
MPRRRTAYHTLDQPLLRSHESVVSRRRTDLLRRAKPGSSFRVEPALVSVLRRYLRQTRWPRLLPPTLPAQLPPRLPISWAWFIPRIPRRSNFQSSSQQRKIPNQIPVGFSLPHADENMPGEPIMLPRGHLKGGARPKIVFRRIHRGPALKRHFAQALHGVDFISPQIPAVVHQNQRPIVFLEHITRVELGRVVRPEQRVVAAAVRHCLAPQQGAGEFSAVEIDRAAIGAARHVHDRLHARES